MRALFSIATLSAVISAIGNPVDVSSYSNINEIHTSHVHLNLDVSFDKRQLSGVASHTMKVVKPSVKSAFFDIVGIDVSAAWIGQGSLFYQAQYRVSSPRPKLGDALEVDIPECFRNGKDLTINITYATNEKQTATSWMTKEQTACGTLEYLYT